MRPNCLVARRECCARAGASRHAILLMRLPRRIPAFCIHLRDHWKSSIASQGPGCLLHQAFQSATPFGPPCTLCRTLPHATLRCAHLPAAGRRPYRLLKRRREDGAMAQQPRWPPAVSEVYPQPAYDAFAAETVLPMKRLRLEASPAAVMGGPWPGQRPLTGRRERAVGSCAAKLRSIV
jgi:hypothetical protein